MVSTPRTDARRTGAALIALATMLASAPAFAQDAAQPADEAAEETETIIVTGTAGAGTRRQDAAYAVTTVDSALINQVSPASTAALFAVIPGVSSESSGGQNGANIFVRGYPSGGDAEYVTLQTQGVPFFPPATLSFLENSQLIRVDETIERVEAVRGGTGALFSSGQPGLTVNFVQREGGEELDGLVKLSATDFGELRGDAYVSGPVGANTYFMVGGFYREGNGIRDPKFTAEKGGQITANLRHDFVRGSVMVFGRYLNDRGQWLLPIPLVQDGNKIRAYPGFSPRTGTFMGPDTRFGTLNDGTEVDMADGRGADIVNLGANFEYELADGFKLRNRTSWLKGSADTIGMVNAGAPPQSAADYAASRGGTIGSLTFAADGSAVGNAADQQVIEVGQWVVRKDIDAFVNDLGVEWKSGGNTFTVGGYYASYSSDDQWNLGNAMLLTATPNARRLNMTLADGRLVTRDGYSGGSTFNVNASYEGRDIALYAVDEFQITPELRIDGGVRYQHHKIDGTLENNSFGVDVDGNPATLYDNSTAVLNGTFSTIRYRGDKFSFTAGANYDFTRNLGAFLRFSRGHSFPMFDNLRDGLDITRRVDTYEGGVKASYGWLNLYATLFHNKFKGLASTEIVGGVPVASVGGARTTGVELEGSVRPVDGLQVAFSGTWLDGEYVDFFTPGTDANGNPITVDSSGNQIQRQPKWQWRVTPSYTAEMAGGKASVFSTLSYIGDRFSDTLNQQVLPHYYKVDAGISFELDNFEFQIVGDNLTNKIALTEGNPRVLGSQGAGVILARPILGRSFRISAGYKF